MWIEEKTTIDAKKEQPELFERQPPDRERSLGLPECERAIKLLILSSAYHGSRSSPHYTL